MKRKTGNGMTQINSLLVNELRCGPKQVGHYAGWLHVRTQRLHILWLACVCLLRRPCLPYARCIFRAGTVSPITSRMLYYADAHGDLAGTCCAGGLDLPHSVCARLCLTFIRARKSHRQSLFYRCHHHNHYHHCHYYVRPCSPAPSPSSTY